MGNLTWLRPFGACVLFTGLALQAGVAVATVRVATPTTVNSVIAALQPGDTMKLEGTFNSLIRIRSKSFDQVVTIDASAAVINASMTLTDVKGINIVGGKYTRANTTRYGLVEILRGTDISMSGGCFSCFAGNTFGRGISATDSTRVTVRDNSFSNVHNSILVTGSTDSLVTRNKFVHANDDGVEVINSSRVIVSSNLCGHGEPHPGAHADCVQLSSIPGKPVNTDIVVLNNRAMGNTQGLTSFDPDLFSGLRYVFAGNFVAVTYPHGIACFGCVDSLFQDNTLVSLPGEVHRVSLNTPYGTNNIFDNNAFYDLRKGTKAQVTETFLAHKWSDYKPSFAAGSLFDSQYIGFVPEPAVWLQFILGFGLIGALIRVRNARERSQGIAQAA